MSSFKKSLSFVAGCMTEAFVGGAELVAAVAVTGYEIASNCVKEDIAAGKETYAAEIEAHLSEPDKEQQAQKNVEKNKELLTDKERKSTNQKDLSKRQMEKIKEEIKEYEKLAESSEEEKLKAQKEKEQLSEQLNFTNTELQKAKKIANQKTEKRKKELEQRWNKIFPKLEFASGVIKNANKYFEKNEFDDIDKVLMDISWAEDPHTLINDLGKMNNSSEEYHIRFSTPFYSDCRLFYKIIKGNANEKRVLITKIVKHNDSRYGK